MNTTAPIRLAIGFALAAGALVDSLGAQAATQFAQLARFELPGAGDEGRAAVMGDIDGDGDLDVILGRSRDARQKQLFLNDGYGRFALARRGQLPVALERTEDLALANVDGNGTLDLIAAHRQELGATRAVPKLYLNSRNGSFTDVSATHLPQAGTAAVHACVAAGDIDGDRDIDLFFGAPGAQDQLYLNNGAGIFTDVSARLPADSDRTEDALFVDVDRDGDLDLVRAIGDARNELYLNSGRGSYTDATGTRMPSTVHRSWGAAAADVDGDGDVDLVFANDRQRNAQYRNDGRGSFTDVSATAMPAKTPINHAVTAGDIDLDGDLDLVFASVSGATDLVGDLNEIYLNNGRGIFADVTQQRFPQDYDLGFDVVLGDVDGDGDPDLVTADEGTARLYLNLHHQLHAPTQPRRGSSFQLDVYGETGHAAAPLLVPLVVAIAELHPAASIPPFGRLGVDLALSVTLPPITLAAPAGRARLATTIPGDPLLAGLTLYFQGLVTHPPTLATWRFTNVLQETVR